MGTVTLETLGINQPATIVEVGEMPSGDHVYLQALGFTPGELVIVQQGPVWGGPISCQVCGAKVAIRRSDAAVIRVRPIKRM